jgi:hypothetical protein
MSVHGKIWRIYFGIAFLWVGIEQAGVRGGEMLFMQVATKAALIGSGYALGRWLTGEAGTLVEGIKQVGYRIPLVGGRMADPWIQCAKVWSCAGMGGAIKQKE